MKLIEWTHNHIKFKDCMKKAIKNIEVKKDHIVVQTKKQTTRYTISTDLEQTTTVRNTDGKETIVTLNTKKNVQTLIDNWDTFSKHPKLTILFVNVKENTYWHVCPKTHNFITDKDSLEEGLWSLHKNA
ncbi:MAG: hypothetical protein ACQESC_00960 [Nanobdellota archaeon]